MPRSKYTSLAHRPRLVQQLRKELDRLAQEIAAGNRDSQDVVLVEISRLVRQELRQSQQYGAAEEEEGE